METVTVTIETNRQNKRQNKSVQNQIFYICECQVLKIQQNEQMKRFHFYPKKTWRTNVEIIALKRGRAVGLGISQLWLMDASIRGEELEEVSKSSSGGERPGRGGVVG